MWPHTTGPSARCGQAAERYGCGHLCLFIFDCLAGFPFKKKARNTLLDVFSKNWQSRLHLGSSLKAEFKPARERLCFLGFFFFHCVLLSPSAGISVEPVCVCVSKCGRRRKSHVCCSRKYRKRALFLNHDSNLQNTQLWLCTGWSCRAPLAYARHISSVRQGCC